MDGFFEYERIPLLKEAKFPFERSDHRSYVLSPDFGNPEHRRGIHHFWRHLFKRDRKLQIQALYALSEEGVIETIRGFQDSRDKSAFEPDYVDLLYLYSHIRKHRPKNVLEYGSGLSTAVMAHALGRNGEGQLVSIEASKEWAQSTAACLPRELGKRVQVVFRAAVPVTLLGYETYCFEDHPVDSPDMVYIDGQAHRECMFSGAENIEWLDLAKGTAIYIDSRSNAIKYFRLKNRTAARFNIAAYEIRMPDYHESIDYPLGSDLVSNALVRVV